MINVETIAEAMNNPDFSFIGSFSDAADSSKVTKEMTRLLFIHRKKREQLKSRERERTILLKNFEKNKRQSYIKHNNSKSVTEKTKTILVEIDTENEKFELDIVEQKIKELTREMSSIKLEIDTWKAISYNLRTEMGSF